MIGGMETTIHIVAKIAVPLFFIGMAGSAFVVIATFIEDFKELLEDEEHLAGQDALRDANR
jgi:hypothetical protein